MLRAACCSVKDSVRCGDQRLSFCAVNSLESNINNTSRTFHPVLQDVTCVIASFNACRLAPKLL